MCVDPDWEPFEKIDADGKHQGIAADLIRLVSQRTGVPIKLIQTSSWKESLEFSKTKKCDILSFLNQTPQRDEWLIFSDSLLVDSNVIITHNEHPYIPDLSKLYNETIALPEGTMVEEHIKRDYPNLKIIPIKTEKEAMRMVSQKKADLTIRSLITSASVIMQEGFLNLKIAGQPSGFDNKLCIGLLMSEPVLRDILNKGVRSITKQEREEIINKHTSIIVQKESDGQLLRLTLYGVALLFTILVLILLWNYLLRKKVRKEVIKNLEFQEQLFQKAKQAEMGDLIAGISHQWREPLSKLSSLNLITMAKLKNGLPLDNETILKQSDEIEKTLDFMSVTMQNFLMFYKKSDKKINFSVAKSIEASLSIIETKIIDYDVKVQLDGDESLSIYGIENEWMQVWLNLINNAIAIFIERKITIPNIRIHITDEKITFCDNGGGMDMTKKSNGLGLNMCRNITSKYGASLHLENSSDGLCVAILLKKAHTL